MAQASTLAARFRRARENFEAGLRLGVTPAEAEQRLRWEQAERKLTAKMHAHRSSRVVSASVACPDADPQDRAEPWYRQGDMA